VLGRDDGGHVVGPHPAALIGRRIAGLLRFAVPALVEMLTDEDSEVRSAAAEALGSFGPAAESAIPALRKAAGDRDENVAREAGLALVKLQKQQP
jgi:HEAT repeat protein